MVEEWESGMVAWLGKIGRARIPAAPPPTMRCCFGEADPECPPYQGGLEGRDGEGAVATNF